MQNKISTDSLLKRIFKTKSLSGFLERNEEHMQSPDFCGMLRTYCEERDMIPEKAILRAQIDRTYGHQLFNGTRRPSRDKVLQLALGIGLSVDETQRLLQSAGKSALYPRIRRDAVLLYCLKNALGMMEAQELLNQYGLTLLGDSV